MNFLRHGLMLRADHDGDLVGTRPLGGGENMRQQAAMADRVQHLRLLRTHARALTGRKHDRQTPPAHVVESQYRCIGALIAETPRP